MRPLGYIFLLWFFLLLSYGRPLYFCRGFFISSFSFFPRLISAVGDWMSTVPYVHTWCGLSANLECRYETYCTRLAENTGRKNRHLGTIAQLCPAIYAQLSTYRQSEKTCQTAITSPHVLIIMTNFGPLAAEIYWRVWVTTLSVIGVGSPGHGHQHIANVNVSSRSLKT